MQKRKLALVALGLCSVMGIAGCGEDPVESQSSKAPVVESSKAPVSTVDVTGTSVDIMINYKKSTSLSYGVSYTGSSAYNNPFDGQTYSQGSILPTWKEFGNKLALNIRDAADYSVHDDDSQFNNIYVAPVSGTKFKTDKGEMVDLWMNSASNMDEVGAAGELVNLLDYLDYMPNFSKWLESNKETKDQLVNDHGEMFVAPYFDGKDAIEKMVMMNTDMVVKLLDSEATYDTATTITTSYTNYIPKYNNEKLGVVGLDGKKMTITVSSSEDIITKQNNLATKNGAELVKALKAYLNETYGAYIGAGKLYENLSDIFVSVNACYNVDELVALMRCVKTNPQLLTGEKDKAVTVLSPRESKNSRAHNVIQFAQVWGIPGLAGEKDYLYFNKDGELCDGRTQTKTYEVGLTNLHKLYSEGLILENYATEPAKSTNYAKTLIPTAQLFMEYDYNATSAQYNATDDNGIGVSGSKTSGFRPVLSPNTIWEDDDHSEYKYTRHSEDNRAVKSGGWVIPKATDNLYGALKLMDFIFSEEGANLQDFGPSSYVDGTMTMADGTVCPKIKASVLQAISADPLALGWNNWYRCYVGSTQGIGHVRNNGLDYQVTNAGGQTGLDNVNKAIAAGVFSLTQTSGDNGFNKSVPTFWAISTADNDRIKKDTHNVYFTNFFKSAMSYDGYHGAVRDGIDQTKMDEIKSHFAGMDEAYLETYKLLVE